MVLKDREVIQKSDHEEDILDDTVFTPISPDEVCSIHTYIECYLTSLKEILITY